MSEGCLGQIKGVKMLEMSEECLEQIKRVKTLEECREQIKRVKMSEDIGKHRKDVSRGRVRSRVKIRYMTVSPPLRPNPLLGGVSKADQKKVKG